MAATGAVQLWMWRCAWQARPEYSSRAQRGLRPICGDGGEDGSALFIDKFPSDKVAACFFSKLSPFLNLMMMSG